MIKVIRDSSLEVFLHEAGPVLYQNESTNSLMLGLCGNLAASKEQSKTPPLLLRMVQKGVTVSAAIQTPPRNLVITYADKDHLSHLVDFLDQAEISLPGVVGPAKEAEMFSQIWSSCKNCRAILGMGQEIYEVKNVILPRQVEGHLRLATIDEADLMAQWLVEFSNEALPPNDRESIEELRSHAENAIERGLLHVWESGKKAVSMAAVGRTTKNGISVGAVYTPKLLRKRGYGSSVVAHLSQKMIHSGKQFCVLYTDLSNPTSNRIYRDIGYREVAGSKYFLFETTQVS